ncbi:MAG: hypothetical protein CMJ95_01120 [Planctomycetes bacterium]|nr:hypothetical protein [Planctomycetota bacterium]
MIAKLKKDPQAMAVVQLRQKQLAAEAKLLQKEKKKAEKERLKEVQKNKGRLYHGITPEIYEKAFLEGVKLMTVGGMSRNLVEQKLQLKYRGIELTGEAIAKHIREGKGDTPPKRPGPEPYLDAEALSGIAGWVKAMRSLDLLVLKEQVISKMQDVIEGTYLQQRFKGGEVSEHHYRRLMEEHAEELDLLTTKPLEVDRSRWCTAANFEKHYNIVAAKLVELGLAVANKDYDSEDPTSCPIVITRPDRIMSMDETHATMDMTDPNGNLKTVAVAGEGASAEILANKGGGDATIIGGSIADGNSVPGLTIFKSTSFFAGGVDPTTGRALPNWTEPSASSTLLGDDGQPLKMRFTCNKVGGYIWKDEKEDVGVFYMKHCVVPAMPGLSPDNPCVVIMDGYGGHLSLALLDYCREMGIHILLRPPHTSNAIQGEDVKNFSVFKLAFQAEKGKVLNRLVLNGSKHRLGLQHLSECVKAPWEKAFSMKRNTEAWMLTGYYDAEYKGMTRKVYWEYKKKEERARQQFEANNGEGGLNWDELRLGGKKVGAADDEGDGEDGEPVRRNQNNAIHSTDVWDMEGGATGDRCYQLIHKKTTKKREVEAENEKKREENQKKKSEAQEQERQLAEEAAQKLVAAAGGGELSTAVHAPGVAERPGVLTAPEMKAMANVRNLDASTKTAALASLRSFFPAPPPPPPPPPQAAVTRAAAAAAPAPAPAAQRRKPKKKEPQTKEGILAEIARLKLIAEDMDDGPAHAQSTASSSAKKRPAHQRRETAPLSSKGSAQDKKKKKSKAAAAAAKTKAKSTKKQMKSTRAQRPTAAAQSASPGHAEGLTTTKKRSRK